jgi:DNA-binding IclR family transcriptional regulator
MDTTLIKGLRVFEHLVRAAQPLGITQMAAALKLQKSNVHRTLAALTEMGYVEKDVSGGYQPTLHSWELGMHIMGRNPVRRAAVSFMQGLHQEFGETVNLAVLEGTECLVLDQIMSPMPIRHTSAVGHRMPALSLAAGIVLLAYQPNIEKRVRSIWEKQTRRCKDRPKPKPNPKLLSLLADLKAARTTGCAYSLGGWREGVNSVAGAILGPDDIPIAAIAVSGPGERMTKERIKTVSRAVLNACTQVGNALGRS